jgi:hypothetical protein
MKGYRKKRIYEINQQEKVKKRAGKLVGETESTELKRCDSLGKAR